MASVIVNPRKHFAPLLDAMAQAGGSLSASEMLPVMGITDKRNLARSLRPAVSAGLIKQVSKGWRSRYAIVRPLAPLDDEPAPPPQKFNACVYLDGTVSMSGVEYDDDGDPILTPKNAAALKRLLNGEVL